MDFFLFPAWNYAGLNSTREMGRMKIKYWLCFFFVVEVTLDLCHYFIYIFVERNGVCKEILFVQWIFARLLGTKLVLDCMNAGKLTHFARYTKIWLIIYRWSQLGIYSWNISLFIRKKILPLTISASNSKPTCKCLWNLRDESRLKIPKMGSSLTPIQEIVTIVLPIKFLELSVQVLLSKTNRKVQDLNHF